MPGFPNLFVLSGPTTGLGHSSMVYMIESQVTYVMDALRHMDSHGAATVQVREDAAERFNAGRNSMLWPDSTWRFRQRTASFDPADFELTQGTPGNADGRE